MEEAEEAAAEAGGTDPKTRTPHNDVGKTFWSLLRSCIILIIYTYMSINIDSCIYKRDFTPFD